jgi:hypothetical protein
MRFVVILLLGAIAALGACKSPDNDAAQASAARCICGTAEADFEGCAHPMCMKGERNPDNPECVCGPMRIGGKQ